MSVTINGTTGITTPDVTSDGLTVDTTTLVVDEANNQVGIGTNSPTSKLDISGGSAATTLTIQTSGALYSAGIDLKSSSTTNIKNDNGVVTISNGDAAGQLRYSMGGTERARINPSGYFKASNNGTYVSSTNIFHELVQSSGNQWNTIISNSASSGTLYGTLLSYTGQSPNNTTSEFFRCEDTTNNKLTIYSSGTVTNRTGTYNSFSDLKLKQDVVDAGSQWSDIKSLRVVNYRLKDEVAADPNYPSYIGLIAQEVEQVSPGLVDECPDVEINENGERVPTGTATKAVKYSILYMKAVKALQEAMERIETLEAKVTALEAKNV